jgi:hypothetical protein
MRKVIIGCIVSAISAFALLGFSPGQGQQLDAKQLRSMLGQLGYEVKDLNTDVGEEKYEVKLDREGLDIYVSYELSASKNYVWLTVLLGDAPSESKALAMLKENANIQPSSFYITAKNKLMMGLPVDNRGLTNTLLRQRTDAICGAVVDSKDLWLK